MLVHHPGHPGGWNTEGQNPDLLLLEIGQGLLYHRYQDHRETAIPLEEDSRLEDVSHQVEDRRRRNLKNPLPHRALKVVLPALVVDIALLARGVFPKLQDHLAGLPVGEF